MNSTLIKLYGFFAGISLIAFLFAGEFAGAQEPAVSSLSTRDQSRIINLANNMTLKIEATNTRLQDIGKRVKFAQGWIKDDWGIETPEVTEKLTAFDQLIAANLLETENIHQEVYAAVTSTEPKTNWRLVREKYLKMQSDLTLAHQLLRESTQMLETADLNWRAANLPGGVYTPPATTTNATTTDL